MCLRCTRFVSVEKNKKRQKEALKYYFLFFLSYDYAPLILIESKKVKCDSVSQTVSDQVRHTPQPFLPSNPSFVPCLTCLRNNRNFEIKNQKKFLTFVPLRVCLRGRVRAHTRGGFLLDI